MKIKKILKLINYRVVDSSSYLWNQYGKNCKFYDFKINPNGLHEDGSFIANNSGKIFEIIMSFNNNEYRWINKNYKKAYKKECEKRKINCDVAYDDVNFINLTKKNMLKTLNQSIKKYKKNKKLLQNIKI